MEPKISIITATNNSIETIIYTINSIKSQNYKNIEHIIVDNKSEDGTYEIIKKYKKNNKNHNIKLIIEKDNGIYDAINKGILHSTGKYICILNSDDIFQSRKTIENIVKKINSERNIDIFFFCLVYFSNKNFTNIKRYYSSINFKKWMINIGLIPPHPAAIIKKSIYDKYGLYEKSYKIAGDFEFFIRLFQLKNLKYKKCDDTIIRMRTGGASGKNFYSYIITFKENYIALKKNKKFASIILLLCKIPFKIIQLYNFSEKKLNYDFEIFKEYYKQKIQIKNIKLIKNLKKIFNKNFVLSGLNLAFLGYYSNNDIRIYKDLYTWPDGISARILKRNNINKIPGRDILKNLIIPNYIIQIRVIGSLSEKSLKYLEYKFNRKIVHNNLPYGNSDELIKFLPKNFIKNELIILTLPTPKQEIIAEHIARHNLKFKIICAGASVAMLSGDEKIVPKFLETLGLEFVWRLRIETKRRLIRLIQTAIYFINGYLNNKIKNIKIEKI
jgi:glycosyltransferase involved in cell wall biosynthesis